MTLSRLAHEAVRCLIAFVWTLLFLIVAFAAVGAIAGAIEAARLAPSQNPQDAGRESGAAAVAKVRPLILFGSIALAFGGVHFGYLPAPKAEKTATEDPPYPKS